MDDVLKRRIAGALVLLALSFVLVSLLPAPGLPTPEEGLQIVTVDLDEKPGTTPEAPVTTVPLIAAATPTPTPAPVPADAPVAAPTAAASASTPGDSAEAGSDRDTQVADPAQQDQPVPAPVVKAPASGRTTVPPPAESPAPVRKAAPEAAPAVVPVRPAVAPEAAATTRPPPKVPAESRPAPAAPAVTATAQGGAWFVQVGGFADVANAHQVQAQLKGQGIGAILSPAETARGTLYRVRAGPYASREQAQTAQQRLAAAYPGCAIVGP